MTAPERPGWDAGWLSWARAVPSPNFGPRPGAERPSLLVLHSISLPPGVFGGPEIEALFTNCLDCAAHPSFEALRGLEVSAHFLIRRDGELLQFVSTDERAWHAGASSFRGRERCNDFSIGIELEGVEGGVFDERQYLALGHLLPQLRERYPLVAVVGHEHIAPGRKADPGSGFDWLRLRQDLGWAAELFPFV
ncbi:1,6-anhydro-N-acetylmuramyl-L-alanine amidase AmpD [Mitsuaria sp. WAJ17]|nr:1,6-anhydro-N-acetylmuramyl-L-alanine amidase AmpD [Mitsuaria sp. WAJ17]MBB2484825.1 1,6-anhydro-N-acetylmuramyl-L-alanine amidase AmpD [Mitsuaria sp. WAJ17]